MPLYPRSCLRKTSHAVPAPRKPNAHDLRQSSKNYFMNNNPGDVNLAAYPAPSSNYLSKRPGSKKRVTFAQYTVNHERETKPYKYHNLFRKEPDGTPWGWLQPKTSGAYFNERRRLQLLANKVSDASDDEEETVDHDPDSSDNDDFPQSSDPADPTSQPVPSLKPKENEYARFTHAKKTPDYLVKGAGAAARSKRLYQLTAQLKRTHNIYNTLEGPEKRDAFLVDEILQRYIMVLDLALTEGYLGFALEITHAMYDTTKYMLPLYSHIFYNLDGSHTVLPILVQESPSFILSLPPVIYALNRISESRSRGDNTGMNVETLLMKLQLEMITLTIAPVQSVIFRAVLEIVSSTAFAAYQVLCAAGPDIWIKWVNNSKLRNDYIGILRKLGMADKIGCKGTLHGVEVQRSISASVYKAELEAQQQHPGQKTLARLPGMIPQEK